MCIEDFAVAPQALEVWVQVVAAVLIALVVEVAVGDRHQPSGTRGKLLYIGTMIALVLTELALLGFLTVDKPLPGPLAILAILALFAGFGAIAAPFIKRVWEGGGTAKSPPQGTK